MRGEILHLVGGFPTIPLGYRLSRLLFLVSLNWSSSVLLGCYKKYLEGLSSSR